LQTNDCKSTTQATRDLEEEFDLIFCLYPTKMKYKVLWYNSHDWDITWRSLIWTFKILKEIISRSEEACGMVTKVTLSEQYLLFTDM